MLLLMHHTTAGTSLQYPATQHHKLCMAQAVAGNCERRLLLHAALLCKSDDAIRMRVTSLVMSLLS